MILPDVNVLVYAHRQDTPDHDRYRDWLESILNGDQAFGIAELVLSGFLRIATHPRIFRVPTPLDVAFSFAGQIRVHPRCVIVQPGSRHWAIFSQLCHVTTATGNNSCELFRSPGESMMMACFGWRYQPRMPATK